MSERQSNFRCAIELAINTASMENGSDTPDFILAEYLTDCLAAFDKATVARRRWHSAEEDKRHLANMAALREMDIREVTTGELPSRYMSNLDPPA